MRLPIGIDGLDTGRSCGGFHFIQAIEQELYLFQCDPCGAELPGNAIDQRTLLAEPLWKRKLCPGPCGEVEYDRERVIRVVFSSLQQFPRQFQEQCGFARARWTKKE